MHAETSLPRRAAARTAARTAARGAALGVLLLLLLAAACVGPGIQAQADVVRSDIKKARDSGAYTCAPRELALAESHVDFAENELAQGDFLRARAHIDLAVTNANAALANSRDCVPRRVLIKVRPDQDKDGILDDVDACPTEPEDKDGFEDKDGCPDPDNDDDTILDVADKCPDVAGPRDNDGCPWGDRDNDGIDDKADACPDAPEDMDGDRDGDGRPDLDVDEDGIEDCVPGCPALPTRSKSGKEIPPPPCDACFLGPPELTREDTDGFEDQDGCPEPDNDRDGLLDAADACPNEPGLPQDRGCPRYDTDGDGYFDDEDACPKKAGVAWPDEPKKNGCPPKLTLVEVTDNEIKIRQQVQFDTGKATIKPASARLLGEVGLVIRQSPNIKKVRVLGHTDDVGDDEYNLDLSRDRADSVRQWLIDQERVEPERLEADGFGETQPIASNRTSAGRQKNRRVEFKVERTTRLQEVVVPDVSPAP